MTREGPEIRVDVPASDRDRAEHDVFQRLESLRAADRIAAVTAPPPHRRWVPVAIGAIAVAASVLVVLVLRRAPAPAPDLAGPSLVVTPVGGSSRFTVGDAVIDAGGDTSVRVQHLEGAIVLALERGSVDCEVAPRGDRPPFRVVAGDVTVEVVGTRFSVARHGEVIRVDVIHGRVRVQAPGGEHFVSAGESWTQGVASAEPAPLVPPAIPATASKTSASDTPASDTPDTEPVPKSATRPATKPDPREAFGAAQRLESTDPRGAARAYRTVAAGKDAWAALALYSLAELDVGTNVDAALRDLDELARRFPRGANAEDAAWLRVDVLRRSGRTDAVRIAAKAYLDAFPRGTYAKAAARLAAASP